MNIANLPSWIAEELTPLQRQKYEIKKVGTSLNSSRDTFSVVCRDCGDLLHKCTNNPSHYIEIHDSVSLCRKDLPCRVVTKVANQQSQIGFLEGVLSTLDFCTSYEDFREVLKNAKSAYDSRFYRITKD